MEALRLTRNTIRVGSVVLMGAAVVVATADGFAQSYSGLYQWALDHKLSGWKADSFPLLVDLFILVGELGLFLLALDGHRLRKQALAWIDVLIPAGVASVGWLVSLWFNVGHVHDATFDDKVTAGVPPITAMIGLLILLRTVHRYMARLDEQAPVIKAERVPEPLPVPEVEHKALEAGDSQDPDERWDKGVQAYRESVRAGSPLSQRALASILGQRNRSLAIKIIRHVKESNGHAPIDGVPPSTGAAPAEEGRT